MDSQVGELLATLESEGKSSETIVVLLLNKVHNFLVSGPIGTRDFIPAW